MNSKNLDVLTNIIGAVESGGQIYGRRNYAAYAAPYTNTKNEHTITLGWAQNYGDEAHRLIKMIYDADPEGFKKIDASGRIKQMLSHNWVSERWNPSSADKRTLIALIDSEAGHKAQDQLFADLMLTFIKDCCADYTSDTKAVMMYCQIRHLGGKSAARRIFGRCGGDYSMNRIMNALRADQDDTSSSNQVGDRIFWSRHEKCREWIEEYASPEGTQEAKTAGYDPAKVIAVAEAEIGYLEKRSNYQLDSKTANAGSNNYTKYGRDMYAWTKAEAGDTYGVDYQWCDQFVDWCFVKAYGLAAAKKLLGGWSAYTPTSASHFKQMGRWSSKPAVGAQIFFRNSERICHTGLVYRFTDDTVYTIEGNTSGASGVISNGGGVCKKSYSRSSSRISGYGIPNYGMKASGDVIPETPGAMENNVAKGQEWLNEYYGETIKKHCGALLEVDGEYGQKTRAAALAVWKDLMNRKFKTDFDPSNTYFGEKCRSQASKATVMLNSTGTFTLICQLLLSAYGDYKGAMDCSCGYETEKAIKSFQKTEGLTQDGACGADTWFVLFN